MYKFFVFLSIILLASCQSPKSEATSSTQDSTKVKIHKEYTVDGKLHSKLEVSHGKINGWATTFYPNGKVMTKCKYQEGIPMDEETMYYKSGKIYRIIPFKDGNKHGWL